MGDSIRAAKDLIKTMTVGLKTVVWCLINPVQAAARAQGQQNPGPSPQHPMSEDERELLEQFFQWALVCLRIYSRASASATGSPAAAAAAAQEAKEIHELFVGALLVMEPRSVRGALSRHLGLYFNIVLQVRWAEGKWEERG